MSEVVLKTRFSGNVHDKCGDVFVCRFDDLTILVYRLLDVKAVSQGCNRDPDGREGHVTTGANTSGISSGKKGGGQDSVKKKW
jgi:hypothetical protein